MLAAAGTVRCPTVSSVFIFVCSFFAVFCVVAESLLIHFHLVPLFAVTEARSFLVLCMWMLRMYCGAESAQRPVYVRRTAPGRHLFRDAGLGRSGVAACFDVRRMLGRRVAAVGSVP